MNPMFSAILFSRYFMCSIHDKFSSIKTTGKEGMLYFFPDLWNNEMFFLH